MRYPFLPARRHGGGQSTRTLHRIVLHSTVTPCKTGWARTVAGWFHAWDKAASAHYVVDPAQVIKCLHDGTIGYHAPPNAGSIGVELCDYSTGGTWPGRNHLAMLRLAARLVADKCAEYDIPVTWLSVADLKAGRRGITSHHNVSLAWHQSTHTDPGGFPVGVFLELVRRAKRAGGEPTQGGGGHPYPGHVLRVDSTDHGSVRVVQAELNRRADTAPHLTVDGIYGTRTQARVRGFQRQHNLAADGAVGPATWAALWS